MKDKLKSSLQPLIYRKAPVNIDKTDENQIFVIKN